MTKYIILKINISNSNDNIPNFTKDKMIDVKVYF